MQLPFLRKQNQETRPSVRVFLADAGHGLSAEQAAERAAAGYANTPVTPPGKNVRQIVLGNIFTYFNIVFFFLAAASIAAGAAWNNLMFMGVVIVNTVIGIVQELRSKKTLDKLNLLTAPKGTVIRDGKRLTLNTAELVRDDIVVFKNGDQIYADAVVVSGECQVNEALVTGEADEIKKEKGNRLLSGSFLVSGECFARLTSVGADSYAGRLTIEAKKRSRRKEGEMMRSLSNLIKWIGLLIIPLGALLCIKEIAWLERSITEGVVSTVAALIGLIPEGLYLLTTLALVASILRLAGKKTLVHEMSCIEALARVDTLCVDKTGTITEPKMVIDSVCSLLPDRYTEEDISLIMRDYVGAMRQDNDTMAALRSYFSGEPGQTAKATLPFTSSKKYGGVSFHEDETYLLGAPDVLLGGRFAEYAGLIEDYSSKGCRVLLLADYGGSLFDPQLTGEILPLALILLNNKLRPEAYDTFRYFSEQGVAIKVISGDNHLTVSEVAKRAGIEGADRCVDARTLTDASAIEDAVDRYTVFGRVTPDQKKKIILALKRKKHTVAMTGDGVNDVLALREADCSVAMASGSDAASQVSDIVLLENNFAVMPSVVSEGRRVINNIQRSATLYLVKNIFSFTLAIVSLIFMMPYPFSAAQLSLVSSITIGFPSFVLAMEPNESLVRGRFLPNVIRQALPAALTDFVLTIGIMLFYYALDFDPDMMSTICAITMGTVGIFVIVRICRPWTLIRKLLVGAVCAAFLFCAVVLKRFFTLAPLDFHGILLTVVFAALAWPTLQLAYLIQKKIESFFASRKRKEKHHAA